MFVWDEFYVRGNKLIDDWIWIGKVQKIIPKDHPRILEKGPKPVCKAVPGRPQTMEQSTTRRLFNAPSMGVIDGDIPLGKEERLFKSLNQQMVSSTARQ